MAFLFHFWLMNVVCHNGVMIASTQPLFNSANRAFKWGDGVFETMKVHKGIILWAHLHFERLYTSLRLLKINTTIQQQELSNLVIELCFQNQCMALARVRLQFYREENTSGFVIEALPLTPDVNEFNTNGFSIDIYPYARKAMDAIANLKSANFLPYILAQMHAQEKGVDDCIVLNSNDQLADTSKANLFLVSKGQLYTPSLQQGCVNGVMRRFLIDELKQFGFVIHQQAIQQKDLEDADEVFLTNAIYGMRWVKTFRKRNYLNKLSSQIYMQLFSTIYQ